MGLVQYRCTLGRRALAGTCYGLVGSGSGGACVCPCANARACASPLNPNLTSPSPFSPQFLRRVHRRKRTATRHVNRALRLLGPVQGSSAQRMSRVLRCGGGGGRMADQGPYLGGSSCRSVGNTAAEGAPPPLLHLLRVPSSDRGSSTLVRHRSIVRVARKRTSRLQGAACNQHL